jgi:polyisoprenoid-binding protein YceI
MKTRRFLHRSCGRGAALAALLLLGGAAAQAQSPGPKLLPAKSELGFVTRQLGVPVEGRFTRFEAQLAFDAAQPETGQVTLEIDTRSASMGVEELDAELPKPGWFDSS